MDTEYHAPNPDAKMKAKKFWQVTAKKKLEDGKWWKCAGTFDNQDQMLQAAAGAVRAQLTVEVFEGEVEWKKYEPTTKGSIEKWNKIVSSS